MMQIQSVLGPQGRLSATRVVEPLRFSAAGTRKPQGDEVNISVQTGPDIKGGAMDRVLRDVGLMMRSMGGRFTRDVKINGRDVETAIIKAESAPWTKKLDSHLRILYSLTLHGMNEKDKPMSMYVHVDQSKFRNRDKGVEKSKALIHTLEQAGLTIRSAADLSQTVVQFRGKLRLLDLQKLASMPSVTAVIAEQKFPKPPQKDA
jgi:hypothetical protein